MRSFVGSPTTVIPKETIEQIFQATRIEEVIGDFVHLKKSGSNFKGLSPFTNEKTPSFMVSPAKGIFKCFSTGKGGNAVTFLMEHEHYSYPEALRHLADKYGIEVKEAEQTPEELARVNERESLMLITGYAAEYFETSLWESDEGKAIGLSYFKERGFREDIIRQFNLGYSPDQWDAFTNAAVEKGYQKELLVKTGLTKQKDERFFDFFKGRVMFPIHNLSGRVIAFGGRTLKADKQVAKYFNSPESEIYNKSRVLYGIYQAKRSIISEDMCYLVEGYTDVLAMHQAGVENVVASSGTALTKDQIRLIQRYSQNITILYDGDSAGIKASFRGIDLILQEGMNVQVALFPDGEDPDSYSRKVSTTELQTFIKENSQDFVVFKTEVLKEEVGSDPLKRAGLIRDLMQSISLIPDSITRSVYTKEIGKKFDIDEQALLTELNKSRQKNLTKEAKQAPQTEPEDEALPFSDLPQAKKQEQRTTAELDVYFQELELITILLQFGDQEIEIEVEEEEGGKMNIPIAFYAVEMLEMDEVKLDDPVIKLIYEEIKAHYAAEEPRLLSGMHFTQHEDQRICSLVADIMSSPYMLSENWTRYHIYTSTVDKRLKEHIFKAIHSLKLSKVNHMIQVVQQEIQMQNPDIPLDDLLMRQNKLLQVKKEIAAVLGRTVVR